MVLSLPEIHRIGSNDTHLSVSTIYLANPASIDDNIIIHHRHLKASAIQPFSSYECTNNTLNYSWRQDICISQVILRNTNQYKKNKAININFFRPIVGGKFNTQRKVSALKQQNCLNIEAKISEKLAKP